MSRTATRGRAARRRGGDEPPLAVLARSRMRLRIAVGAQIAATERPCIAFRGGAQQRFVFAATWS
jgi:hypothetical protein